MRYYTGGVAVPPPAYCPTSKINHAVTLVGFGMDGNLPYWLIKNSWGTHWGENGYYRLVRGRGACGINLSAMTAIVEKQRAAEEGADILV